MHLHEFQQKAVEEIEGYRRPLLVAPTGSGKTVIASAVIDRAPNSHVLFLAHRRELIHQARNKLKRSVSTLASFLLVSRVITCGEYRWRASRRSTLDAFAVMRTCRRPAW